MYRYSCECWAARLNKGSSGRTRHDHCHPWAHARAASRGNSVGSTVLAFSSERTIGDVTGCGGPRPVQLR